MKRRVARLGAVFMACVFLTGIGPSWGTGNADDRYAAIAKTYFYADFSARPSDATNTGIHTYDTQLDDLSAAAWNANLARDRSTLAAVTAINPASLSPEVRIDRQMLIYSLDDDLLVNGTMQSWRHHPDLYTQVASSSVYGLISRDFAPLPARLADVVARERAFPKLFAQAETNTTTVDSASALAAYEDTSGSVSFFTHDVPLAFTSVSDPKVRAQFNAANAAAATAVKKYAAWIKAGPLAHPSGTFAIGADVFRKRLLDDDAIDMTVPQYLAIGERALAATSAQFIATLHRIDPKATNPVAVEAAMGREHPTAAQLIPTAQQDLVKLRAFIISHHIITLPPGGGDITVIATPPFARSQTLAAEDPPGVLEKVATQAYYWVTPPDPSWPKTEQNALLSSLNNFFLPIVSAHEVYPGHYTNFIIDQHLPLSLTRKLIWNTEFGEGWAHYDEQMIVDEGWGNGDPRVRLAQLGGALLRECRFIVGAKEATQGMTLAQGTAFMQEHAFLTHDEAGKEALRGTQDPMYGYYTLGKMMILKLRSDYRRKLGSAYTLEKFHDALLAHGDPPIPLLRPLLLGAADDGKPL